MFAIFVRLAASSAIMIRVATRAILLILWLMQAVWGVVMWQIVVLVIVVT